MAASPERSEGYHEAFYQGDRGPLAFVQYPCPFVIPAQVLKVLQLGKQARARARQCSDESPECIVLVMTRLFRDPISPAEAVDPLNSVLLFN
jgi:hypothetical protein